MQEQAEAILLLEKAALEAEKAASPLVTRTPKPTVRGDCHTVCHPRDRASRSGQVQEQAGAISLMEKAALEAEKVAREAQGTITGMPPPVFEAHRLLYHSA